MVKRHYVRGYWRGRSSPPSLIFIYFICAITTLYWIYRLIESHPYYLIGLITLIGLFALYIFYKTSKVVFSFVKRKRRMIAKRRKQRTNSQHFS